MIDLHSHTDESDGSLTPRQLIELAQRVGLEAMSITDHDTFKGYEKAREFAKAEGLDLMQGIELNSRFTVNGSYRSAHLLAYFPFREPGPIFVSWLDDIRRERTRRNQKLIATLRDIGLDITLAEVEQKGKSLTGRPHFARVLVDKGYATSLQDAFDRYLGEEAPSYVHRESLSTVETVALVRQGGGIPVIAHPIRLGLANGAERAFFEEAKDAGLLGLEVYHSEHSPALQQAYLETARKLDLIPTGGSDYHGPSVKPDIELGTGRSGNIRVPITFLDGIRELAARL